MAGKISDAGVKYSTRPRIEWIGCVLSLDSMV